MLAIPRNHYRKRWVNPNGEVFLNLGLPGEPMLGLAAILVPTAQETRRTLRRIRHRTKISRAKLAIILGTGVPTVRSWESGARTPCRAARRLVQLTERIFFSDKSFNEDLSAIMIGHINTEEIQRINHVLLPRSARARLERFMRMKAAREGKQRPERSEHNRWLNQHTCLKHVSRNLSARRLSLSLPYGVERQETRLRLVAGLSPEN